MHRYSKCYWWLLLLGGDLHQIMVVLPNLTSFRITRGFHRAFATGVAFQRERSLLRSLGPVPFGICICSTCWDEYFSQAFRDFSGCCTSNIPSPFSFYFTTRLSNEYLYPRPTWHQRGGIMVPVCLVMSDRYWLYFKRPLKCHIILQVFWQFSSYHLLDQPDFPFGREVLQNKYPCIVGIFKY